MFKLLLLICLVAGIGSEVLAGYTLVTAAEAEFTLIICAHFLAALFGTLFCSFSVPVTVTTKRTVQSGFFFLLIIVIPFFGLFGLLLSVIPALFYPRTKPEVLWRDVPIPDLPFKPVMVSERPNYGVGGLASVMNSSCNTERRIGAVNAMRKIAEKVAVPLLQDALKDPVDDVRLFAYSVLDQKANDIYQGISALQAELRQEGVEDVAGIHYALAQHYWELAYLELVSGHTLVYIYEQAEYHANLSAGLGWAGSDVSFLIGRIYLNQGKYAQSVEMFNASLDAGALPSAILPFLAEVAFERHNFMEVHSILASLSACCKGHTPIPAVVQAWA